MFETHSGPRYLLGVPVAAMTAAEFHLACAVGAVQVEAAVEVGPMVVRDIPRRRHVRQSIMRQQKVARPFDQGMGQAVLLQQLFQIGDHVLTMVVPKRRAEPRKGPECVFVDSGPLRQRREGFSAPSPPVLRGRGRGEGADGQAIIAVPSPMQHMRTTLYYRLAV